MKKDLVGIWDNKYLDAYKDIIKDQNSKVSSSTQPTMSSETKTPLNTQKYEMVIHVIDPNLGTQKDFVLNQKILITRMKFFERYINNYMASKAFKKQESQVLSRFMDQKTCPSCNKTMEDPEKHV